MIEKHSTLGAWHSWSEEQRVTCPDRCDRSECKRVNKFIALFSTKSVLLVIGKFCLCSFVCFLTDLRFAMFFCLFVCLLFTYFAENVYIPEWTWSSRKHINFFIFVCCEPLQLQISIISFYNDNSIIVLLTVVKGCNLAFIMVVTPDCGCACGFWQCAVQSAVTGLYCVLQRPYLVCGGGCWQSHLANFVKRVVSYSTHYCSTVTVLVWLLQLQLCQRHSTIKTPCMSKSEINSANNH